MLTPLPNGGYRVISQHDFAEVREFISSGQKALFSLQTFFAGEILVNFSAADIHTTPNYLTVQIGDDQHIILYPTFIQYINHSCAPNCFFDTTAMQLVALTSIEAGAELTFFYPSTEWEMQQPFLCNCGNTSCLREIRGAAHLTTTQVAKYRLTDFIMKKRNKAQ